MVLPSVSDKFFVTVISSVRNEGRLVSFYHVPFHEALIVAGTELLELPG